MNRRTISISSQSVYPGLQRNYDYWWGHNMVGGSLFGGGAWAWTTCHEAAAARLSGRVGRGGAPAAVGAPRPTPAAGWRSSPATWRASLPSCATRRARRRYWVDRGTIQEAINSRCGMTRRGFYYDLNTDGSFVSEKSYAGLVPLIAGVVPPERVPRHAGALRDENEFLSPAGIRSLSAASPMYLPGTAGKDVNSNWRGPVWLPINYLLIDALTEVDPSLAEDVRDRVVNKVETDWRATGRLHEFFDGDTGGGLGADENAGWTALVANLIRDSVARRHPPMPRDADTPGQLRGMPRRAPCWPCSRAARDLKRATPWSSFAPPTSRRPRQGSRRTARRPRPHRTTRHERRLAKDLWRNRQTCQSGWPRQRPPFPSSSRSRSSWPISSGKRAPRYT